jgi:hypothetical protein
MKQKTRSATRPKRNEMLLNGTLDQFKTYVLEHKGELEYTNFEGVRLPLVEEIDGPMDFDVAPFVRCGSFFIYSRKENKVLFNYSVEESVDERLKLTEKFFAGLPQLSGSDLMIDVFDMDARKVHYYRSDTGTVRYHEEKEAMWYRDLDRYPYFVDAAKHLGLKKRRLASGKAGYSEDDIYDLIYNFTDELLNGRGALHIAPVWYQL